MTAATTTPTLADRTPKGLGAFYTSPDAAGFLANWAIRSASDVVLEPAMGDGAFVDAARQRFEALGAAAPDIHGFELARDTFDQLVESGAIDSERAHLGDFLASAPSFRADCVIGNPPFVRLRHLPPGERAAAIDAATDVLGAPPKSSASTWMPFVLHSLRFLARGGRLALVLPFEVTYVDYAKAMWEQLAASFSELTVIRIRERLFPDILQECVLLLADGYGGSTAQVGLAVHETRADAFGAPPVPGTAIDVDLLASTNHRLFDHALLPAGAAELLAELEGDGRVRPVSGFGDMRIGYVTGDKRFFHPDREVQERFGISEESLHPTVDNGRALKGCGLLTSQMRAPAQLFSPGAGELTPGDEAYVRHGVRTKVHRRYKCQVRTPWYRVPGLRVPDVLFPVFGTFPLAIANDARRLASNSLLCGHLTGAASAEAFVAAWHTNLTRLMIELYVHSLGGGVFVMVPREVAEVRLPVLDRVPAKRLRAWLGELDRLVAAGDVHAALAHGDEVVLKGHLGLSDAQVRTIIDAADELESWRLSASR